MQRNATNKSNHIFKREGGLFAVVAGWIFPIVIFFPIFINATGKFSFLSENPQSGYFHISIFLLIFILVKDLIYKMDISRWIFLIFLAILFTISLLSPYGVLASVQYILPAIITFFMILNTQNGLYFANIRFIPMIVLTWSILHLLSLIFYDYDYTKIFGFQIYQAYTYYPSVLYLWASVFFLYYLSHIDNNPSLPRRIFMHILYLIPYLLSTLSSRRIIMAQLVLSALIFSLLGLRKMIVNFKISYSFVAFLFIGAFVLLVTIIFYRDIGNGDVLRLLAIFNDEFNISGGRISNLRLFVSELSLSLLIFGTDTLPVESNFHNSLLDAVYRFGIGHGVLIFICLGLIYRYLWVNVPSKYRANLFCLILPASLLPIFLNSGFFQLYFFVNFVFLSISLPSALNGRKVHKNF